MFDKIMDNAFAHLFMLALGVAAFFLGFKAASSYLPENGVGGSIKHVIKAI